MRDGLAPQTGSKISSYPPAGKKKRGRRVRHDKEDPSVKESALL
jgi:hypothetical protein